MKSRGSSFAMLLKTKCNGLQNSIFIHNLVYRKPAGENIAASTLAGPIESPLNRIMERVTLETGVGTGLKLTHIVGDFEIRPPLLVSPDIDCEKGSRSVNADLCIARKIIIILPLADKISGIAAEKNMRPE